MHLTNTTKPQRVSLISDVSPNFALAQVSTYEKQQGNITGLKLQNADKVYISCIFTKNKERMLGTAKYYGTLGCEVHTGGSGISLTKRLPPEIEACQPDFSLYPVDYAFGFSSRGCPRNCKPHCIVPVKEGCLKHVGYSWIQGRDKVMDWANNFLADPKSTEMLKWLIESKIKICWNQGLDIRLVTEDNAALLAKCRARDKKFERRRYYFAFDDLSIEKDVRRGVAILNKAGIRSSNLMFYEFVGLDKEANQIRGLHKDDVRRYEILNELGCMTYPMKYHSLDKTLNLWTWWILRRYAEIVPFDKLDRSLQGKKNKPKLLPKDQQLIVASLNHTQPTNP